LQAINDRVPITGTGLQLRPTQPILSVPDEILRQIP
jgi:hypothetical protein